MLRYVSPRTSRPHVAVEIEGQTVRSQQVETKRTVARAALMAILVMSAGCAPADEADDVCARAAQHLSACLGEAGDPAGSLASGECDVRDAGRVVAMDCETLQAALTDAKADGWVDGLACRFGVPASCPDPGCHPGIDEATAVVPPADDEPCIAWRRYEGCGACGYFRCREALDECGADGYLTAYGGKYCERFATVAEPRVRPVVASWLQGVRRCLIDAVEEGAPAGASCDETREIGFSSHAKCYVDHGFCELTPADWWTIVHTIDLQDLPLRDMIRTGNACFRRWTGRGDP